MRQRIESGFWSEGDKISTLEELEKEFDVARVTVRQAIELLRGEGLLNAQQGRGTFVSGTPENNRWLNLAGDFETMLDTIRNNVIERVEIREHAPPPELAEGEGKLAEGYTFLRSVQYSKGKPFSVVNLHLAQDVFDRHRESFRHTAALPHLVEMPELGISHAYQTVTIGIADPTTAQLLKIGLGEPTADCRLTVTDRNDIAVYVADIHYQKSIFALRVDLLANQVPATA